MTIHHEKLKESQLIKKASNKVSMNDLETSMNGPEDTRTFEDIMKRLEELQCNEDQCGE